MEVTNTTTWRSHHALFRNAGTNLNSRAVGVVFFAGLTALLAQFSFLTPWSPVPYTFQTMGVLITGVYLRRNDAFLSGLLYVGLGAAGAPFYAGGASGILEGGQLIPSAGYLLAFPVASALVAEGLDRSHRKGMTDLPAQVLCWSAAMVPVYIAGTWWLSVAYSVGLEQAFAWGTRPFLVWDAVKIVVLMVITAKVFRYTQPDA